MSMTKDGAEAQGVNLLAPPPTDEEENDRLHCEARDLDILECADAVVGILKGVERYTLHGAEIADGAVRRAFVDAAMLCQKARHRLSREAGVEP